MAGSVTLWAAGSSNRGQLGIDSFDDARAWTAVALPADVLSEAELRHAGLRIAAGATHTLLTIGDRHFACGRPLRFGEGDQASFVECSTLAELGLAQARLAELGIESDAIVAHVGCSWEMTCFGIRSRIRGRDRICSVDEAGQLSDLARPPGDDTGTIERLVCGPRHSVALTGDGTLIGWGAGRHGQLGSSFTSSHAPAPLKHALLDRSRIVDIAAGRDHTVIVIEDRIGARSVIALGSNKRGQLGASDQGAREGSISASMLTRLADDGRPRSLVAVHATWTSTLVTARVGEDEYEVWTCGTLGPAAPSTATALRRIELPHMTSRPVIASGSEHVLALIEGADGGAAVLAWGWNEHGNLGLGHLDDVPEPRPLVNLPGRPVAVAVGNATSWVAVASD